MTAPELPECAPAACELLDDAGAHRPWLTLVHGASQDGRVFDRQVEDFVGDYRLCIVDLAGHGRSAALPGPYGPLEYTAGVLAALDEAGIARTALWGTHTGAQVGLALATLHPERLSALVLEGAVIPGRPLASVAECLGRARTTLAHHGLEAARDEWFERSPWFEVMRAAPQACRADAHRRLVDDFGGAPWACDRTPAPLDLTAGMLARIATPVLLVNGEHEVPDFLPAAEELESTLRDVQRITVPEAGGFPLWEFPTIVNAPVREFLAGVLSDASS